MSRDDRFFSLILGMWPMENYLLLWGKKKKHVLQHMIEGMECHMSLWKLVSCDRIFNLKNNNNSLWYSRIWEILYSYILTLN